MANLSSQGNVFSLLKWNVLGSLSSCLYFHPEILHMPDFLNIAVLSL